MGVRILRVKLHRALGRLEAQPPALGGVNPPSSSASTPRIEPLQARAKPGSISRLRFRSAIACSLSSGVSR